MVSKVLKFLNREVGAVNQAALLLGIFTLLSQILGLVRDRLFTSRVGVGSNLDVYYASFQIPDLIFNLIATLISVTVVLPILLKITEEEGKEKSRHFFNQIFTSFSVLIVLVSICVFFLIPSLASQVAPGFSQEQLDQLISLSRIILVSPILLGLSNIFASITQMTKRFVLFAISPLLYNLGIILGVLFFYEQFGMKGLAYGVILGSFMHAFIQLPALIKDKMVPRFVKVVDWRKIREMTFISLPRTFGLVAHSLTLIVLISLATTIKDGSVSIFRLSMNLQNIPLALIGASFSVAAFPALAKDFTSGKTKEFLQTVTNAARQIIFWSIPITVLFIVLRAQIVRVILGSQTFSWQDTRLAAATLAMFVISVTAQSLILLFTRAFYATGDTKRPTIINALSSVFVIVIAFFVSYAKYDTSIIQNLLADILRVDGVSGTKVIVLAFIYSIGSILNALILMFVFRKKYMKVKYFGLQKTLQESLIGALMMGITAYIGLNIFDNIFNLSTFGGVFLQGGLSGIFALVLGVWIYYLLDNEEFLGIKNALQRKFKRNMSISLAQGDVG